MMRSQDGEDAGADDGSSGAPIESDFQERRFRLSEPRRLSSCVVFSSPHSGRAYFREFLAASRLGPLQLRASEDAYVDALVDGAVEFGAPVLSAVAPRAFLDLNRGPEELDPSLVIGARGRAANARVLAGLGVVPRIVAEGVSIYRAKMPLSEARRRIAEWHAPYHDQLLALLLRARRRFGAALLLDFHSMPSMSPKPRARQGETAAEIILGDRFGASAPPELVDEVEAAFLTAGFRTARNAPFAGGYITERYGQPETGVHAIQIEIDRALYLDEASVRPSARFDDLRQALAPVLRMLCGVKPGRARRSGLLAAE